MLVYERIEVLSGDDIRSNITISSFGTLAQKPKTPKSQKSQNSSSSEKLQKRIPDKNKAFDDLLDSDLEGFDFSDQKLMTIGNLLRTTSSIPGSKKRKKEKSRVKVSSDKKGMGNLEEDRDLDEPGLDFLRSSSVNFKKLL